MAPGCGVDAVSDLPSGWHWECVAEFADGGLFSDGDWVETKDQDPQGEVRLTQLADVGVGSFRNRSDRRLRRDQAAALGCTYLAPNDILIARMPDPIGRACLVPAVIGEAVTVVDVAVLRIRRPDVVPTYVMWAINSPTFRQHVEALQSGTTRKRISRRNLATLRIPVPPLEEQRRIVAILDDHLSRLDAADSLLRKSSVRLRGLGEAIMRSELLGTTHAGARHPPNLPAVGTNDGVLAHLPPGWRWTRLGELADVVGGVTKDAKRQSDLTFVEVPYLRVANVQRGRLDLSKISTIRVPPAKAAALRLLPGDVLLNEGGDRDKLGRGWVWDGQIPDCIHQNHVFRARVIDDSIDPRLLSWAANLIGGPWCESNGIQSVNLASISLKKIRLMPVPVPPVELQPAIAAKIADRLAGIEHLHRDLDAALNRSKALRRSLLEAAFSGRLTGSAVPDSAAESASTEASSVNPPSSQAPAPTPNTEDATHD
ncbi:MAG: hypothetical protein QG597_1274 [Actinomycetota bacterium]|nr:hypothetical protein [Actinomycetota bacterium]